MFIDFVPQPVGTTGSGTSSDAAYSGKDIEPRYSYVQWGAGLQGLTSKPVELNFDCDFERFVCRMEGTENLWWSRAPSIALIDSLLRLTCFPFLINTFFYFFNNDICLRGFFAFQQLIIWPRFFFFLFFFPYFTEVRNSNMKWHMKYDRLKLREQCAAVKLEMYVDRNGISFFHSFFLYCILCFYYFRYDVVLCLFFSTLPTSRYTYYVFFFFQTEKNIWVRDESRDH